MALATLSHSRTNVECFCQCRARSSVFSRVGSSLLVVSVLIAQEYHPGEIEKICQGVRRSEAGPGNDTDDTTVAAIVAAAPRGGARLGLLKGTAP